MRAHACRSQDRKPLPCGLHRQKGAARADSRSQPAPAGKGPVPHSAAFSRRQRAFVSLSPGTAQDRFKKRAGTLGNAGYLDESPERCIVNLIRRFQGEEFPHEIGLFLSYPPEDVQGFIENHAQNYKLSGLWKVYGDEAYARAAFAKYKKCTDIYCRSWRSGASLEALTVAS